MLIVVNLHRRGIDMGFQGIKGIWKIRNRVGIGISGDQGTSGTGSNGYTDPFKDIAAATDTI